MRGLRAFSTPWEKCVHYLVPRVLRGWGLMALALLGGACGQAGPGNADESSTLGQQTGAPVPVGLALEVDNGVGVPLRVRAGQRFYIDQLDLRASVAAAWDEGVEGLDTQGDFAFLAWQGVHLVDEEPNLLANPDGTYTRRRFYRHAQWMNVPNYFIVQPVDALGHPTGRAITLDGGSGGARRARDDFFIRRMRAIQWTYDCVSHTDCAGATAFEEEALVELRNARTVDRTPFTLSADTHALQLHWSQRPGAPYVIPVQQVRSPAYAYGFDMDVRALTAPRADGTYAPGAAVTFQLTLRDGAGNRLHPDGSLPTYNEVAFGPNPAGIGYYRAFFDPSTTYYRRKHRERMLMVQILGPAQNIQPIRSIIDLPAFLGPDDVQTTGTLEDDGVYAQFQTFPPANKLFGGAFDPLHAGWAAPVSDTWTFQLPANAPPGTYRVTVKGRRTYLGEDRPASHTLEIQVGTPQRTEATLTTGPCDTCHGQGGELGTVLHGNGDRAACAGCHIPLGFELEGLISVRTHFIHSRSSERLGAPLSQCSTCHLTQAGIQRTSKSACLSCHKSYPNSHVASFGPLESMYIGGGRESFQQCTSACHTAHPGSGF
jgi:hypothetical protein